MGTKMNPGTEPVTGPTLSGPVPVVLRDADATVDPAITQLRQQLVRMAALSELISHMESAEDVTDTYQVLAEQLKSYLSVDRVLVGRCSDRSVECKLTAVSGVLSFHPRGELAVAAQAVLQECIARGEAVCWPTTDVARSGGLLAHQQFSQTADVSAIFSAPLRDVNGQLRGAWMVIGDARRVHSQNVIRFLQTAGTPVASALKLVSRAQKGRIHQAVEAMQQWACEKRGRAIMTSLALFALLLCIPVHYHAKCDCTVEPVMRRFVAAPFNAPLEKAFVEPGDLVEKGQLLARIDGRELRMELSGTRADLHRATKQRAGHLALHDSGESEIARHEVDRLRMRTDLLEHRRQNVDICSPISGVVVSGDLEDVEGMPLEKGQTLFEISPLDEMIVEVSIAEDDYAYVRAGMPVSLRLDAFPLRKFNGSIQRVHPRAELRDESNVFVAEVFLQDAGVGFRPGMRGTAKIKADRAPLGWNWFRRPITAVVAWLGW